MIPKSAQRFSDRIMRQTNSMIPTRRAALAQSGHRFLGQIMRKAKQA
jgi:hypothetical protein